MKTKKRQQRIEFQIAGSNEVKYAYSGSPPERGDYIFLPFSSERYRVQRRDWFVQDMTKPTLIRIILREVKMRLSENPRLRPQVDGRKV